MSTWNGKRFSVYTSDEKSTLGLIKELGGQTNYNTDELEKVKISDSKKVSHQEMKKQYKIDEKANFTGSWWGVSKPTKSNEGIASIVENLNENEIPNIKDNITLLNSEKATKQELETEKARIDLLTSVQGGQTEGNAELLDIRIGVNGKTYSTSGNAVRDSLNAIYNGLGGFYCKDITNLNEYSSNSSFGTIKNKNVITTNVSEMNIVPTNTTKANRNYLVYCSEDIYNLATVDPSLGSFADKGVSFNNIGFITPKADKNVIFISLKDLSINKDIYFYLIDVTETSITQENYKYFDEKYINSWFFKEIDNIITTKNIVKNDGKVFDFKIWQDETWEKVDNETILAPYDKTSTIKLAEKPTQGNKYLVLFTGKITQVRTLKDGLWSNTGTINNNIGEITITNTSDALFFETTTGGTNKVYLIDVTNNFELEKFVKQYGILSLGFDYKKFIDNQVLKFFTSTNPNSTNTWFGKKWIAYGDSITEQNSYTQKVANKLGLKMINKGIGGTTIADQDGNNTNAFCRDERINTFDTDADLVTIMGGTNDWERSEIGDLTYSNGFDTTKFKGALATTIIKIQNRCPNATIVVCSPIGGRYTKTGVNANIPIQDKYGKTTYDIAKACEEVAEYMGVHYCNTWCCGINNWNRVDNIEDGVHPTQDKGTDKIAVKLIGTLKSIEPLN